MWQTLLVGIIICAAILYLIRRHFRNLRSSDPCSGCSSCCDSVQKEACSGIVDMRSPEQKDYPAAEDTTGHSIEKETP